MAKTNGFGALAANHQAMTGVAGTAATEMLGSLVYSMQDSVICTNAAGEILWVNPGFETLTGYTSDEVVGKKPGVLLQGRETDPETVEMISNKLKNGEHVNCELINYTKDGIKYWNELAITPLTNEAGEVSSFVSIQKDVSSRKSLEEILL